MPLGSLPVCTCTSRLQVQAECASHQKNTIMAIMHADWHAHMLQVLDMYFESRRACLAAHLSSLTKDGRSSAVADVMQTLCTCVAFLQVSGDPVMAWLLSAEAQSSYWNCTVTVRSTSRTGRLCNAAIV